MSENSEGLAGGNGKALGTDHVDALIAPENRLTARDTQAKAFHPLADLFPLMEGAEFEELVADIKANGQHARIVLKDGMILDGRNRYRACRRLGVEPSFACEAYSDQIIDPAAYVVSANIRRRHLNREQRAELIIKIIASAPEKSDRQIAKSVGVDHKTIGAARAKGEQLGSIPQLKKTMGADGKARKRPQSRTERRQARIDRARGRHSNAAPQPVATETNRATARAAAAPDSNPLIDAWDKATRTQRHEFILARKLEIMRAQQQIGPAAHEPTAGGPEADLNFPAPANPPPLARKRDDDASDVGDQTGGRI
jgi:ParB-like chromosome segregation protein Spo0J